MSAPLAWINPQLRQKHSRQGLGRTVWALHLAEPPSKACGLETAWQGPQNHTGSPPLPTLFCTVVTSHWPTEVCVNETSPLGVPGLRVDTHQKCLHRLGPGGSIPDWPPSAQQCGHNPVHLAHPIPMVTLAECQQTLPLFSPSPERKHWKVALAVSPLLSLEPVKAQSLLGLPS